MIISGVAIPIATLNANQWGVSQSETTNAVASLRQSVVRLCSDFNHSCDFTDSKKHIVGSVLDAYLDEAKNAIVAKVSITNAAAQNLIKQGKIKAWSVFGTGRQNDDGFVTDYTNKSLTLVADPAWDDARFASRESSEGLSDGDYKKFTAKYDIKEEAMPDNEEDKFTNELEKKFAAKDTEFAAKFDQLTAKFDQVIAAKETEISDLKNEISELKASTVRLPKEEPVTPTITDITTDLTSVKARLLKESDVDKLVAAKLNEYKEQLELDHAIKSYKEVSASLAIDIPDGFFDGKTAKMINTDISVLQKVGASRKVSEPVYRAIPEEFDNGNKLTIGIPTKNEAGVIEWRT